MKKINIMDEYKIWREHSTLKTNEIYNMDCLEGLRKMPDNSVDLILSDPPYFLETKKGKGTGVIKELMERIITNSSLYGETVFCSGGYGTSIRCCMDMGRHYVAYEPDMDKFMHCIDAIEKEKPSFSDQYTGQIT